LKQFSVSCAAILFICEIDNLSFHLGLSETAKARVEETGRITLTPLEARTLAMTKPLQVTFIMVHVMRCVHGREIPASILSSSFTILAGKLVEVLVLFDQPKKNIAKFIARSFAEWFGGVMIFFFVFFAAWEN
jgi:hypothetical protein